ncbi:ABC transporter permease [Anaerobacillus sp. CMMVII]|uniref:ABC transporter permease n=1 Tax=Anaerobacillus sp. CMMVII TaxID=2755588 RepID=UPI0021B75968|nr:ABC transporter permease [Anaerobacillus sp. CMMVII]MCT8137994.1 ABC transporter permease [Anaerobacillus sp. CMMVII]
MIWVMTVKDLKLMLRDRKALLITVLMPAILTAILGFSIGAFFNNEIQLDPAKVGIVSLANMEEDTKKLETFLNEQQGANVNKELLKQMTELNFEELLLNDVLQSSSITQFINYEVLSFEQAEKQLEEGLLEVIIVIPEHFHFDMWVNYFTTHQQNTEIRIVSGVRNEIKVGIVEMIVKGFTDHLSVGIVGKQVLLAKATELNVATEVYSELGGFLEKMLTSQLEETLFENAQIVGKETITSFHYYAVGMGVMFMLYSAGFAASYCVNERFLLTYSRIKVAGISLFQILSARMLSASLFTVLQLGFLILFSTLLFQISWGGWGFVSILTIAASLTVGCLAVLLSVINLQAANERISNVFQSVIIPLMAMIGGSFIPNGGFPEF